MKNFLFLSIVGLTVFFDFELVFLETLFSSLDSDQFFFIRLYGGNPGFLTVNVNQPDHDHIPPGGWQSSQGGRLLTRGRSTGAGHAHPATPLTRDDLLRPVTDTRMTPQPQ